MRIFPSLSFAASVLFLCTPTRLLSQAVTAPDIKTSDLAQVLRTGSNNNFVSFFSSGLPLKEGENHFLTSTGTVEGPLKNRRYEMHCTEDDFDLKITNFQTDAFSSIRKTGGSIILETGISRRNRVSITELSKPSENVFLELASDQTTPSASDPWSGYCAVDQNNIIKDCTPATLIAEPNVLSLLRNAAQTSCYSASADREKQREAQNLIPVTKQGDFLNALGNLSRVFQSAKTKRQKAKEAENNRNAKAADDYKRTSGEAARKALEALSRTRTLTIEIKLNLP